MDYPNEDYYVEAKDKRYFTHPKEKVILKNLIH